MKWIANTYDPKDKDWKCHIIANFDETHEQACDAHLQRLEGKVIGKPKGTAHYTVEQLENNRIVGVYQPEVGDTFKNPHGYEVVITAIDSDTVKVRWSTDKQDIRWMLDTFSQSFTYVEPTSEFCVQSND